jgi:DNA-binding PadR family transcriptional regulator
LAKADFNHLKASLELTNGNLGRHLQALEDAGLITQTRESGAGRPRTWIKITARGRRALRDEIQALQRLLGELQPNEMDREDRTERAAPARPSETSSRQ